MVEVCGQRAEAGQSSGGEEYSQGQDEEREEEDERYWFMSWESLIE